MITEHFTFDVPFKDVYITGLVRDKDGQKMSKSKGNVLDPIDLIDGISIEALVAKRTSGLMKPTDAPKIEKATRKEFPEGIPAFGADALRFTFASLATHGRDIKFDLARCEGYKNFCNKLWNAARFVLMNTEGFSASGVPTPTTDAERWILDRLQQLLKEVEAQFAAYRFDLASQAMYEFVWNEVCDWFLELSKPALQGSDAAAIASTRHTLLYVIEQSLRVLHPLIPFVTEEIWSHVAPKLGLAGNGGAASTGSPGGANQATASISVQSYPTFNAALTDARAAADIEWLKSAITALRSIRSQLGVPPGKAVPLLLAANAGSTVAPADRARIERHAAGLKFLAKLESIDWVQGEPPAAAAAVLGELTLLVPLAGLVDLDAERARLDKEIKRVEGEIGKCHGKLSSETFVANAPAAVVEQERKRLAEWTTMIEGLKANRARF
jgi:valyl-tRNA synthetase